ncbi:MAG: hypothetical protein WDA11_02310 [Thiohalomonadaceae bacterium]
MNNECIEALCRSGCAAVRATIQALEQGQDVAQVRGLPSEERRAILEELKTIMAVYDAR